MNNRQSGNALIIVLITVALFGALIFTFTRSASQGSGNLTAHQSRIAAQDITAYAHAIENAVNRVRAKSISESDLDFRNDVVTPAYENTACSENSCRIFHPEGGKAVWQSPPTGANDGSEWVITGAVRINQVGTDGTDAANADLTLFLPKVSRDACLLLNDFANVANPSGEPPAIAGVVNYNTAFTGVFAAGSLISHAELDGKNSGCFENGGAYHFYHVLFAR